ncbi:MAG: DUF4276 family protein [Chloroherpetonaceae bacterium]
MKECLLAVEDDLSEIVARRLIEAYSPLSVQACYGKSGFGYLKANISKFQKAARQIPYFVLTDLDRYPCATALREDWKTLSTPPNFMFRIAVRSVESWLMADRKNFADFLGIAIQKLPLKPDDELNPKRLLIELAKKSNRRVIREDLVPKASSTAKVGRNYNARLGLFAREKWNIESAQSNSQSLARATRALENFKTFH